MQKLLIKKAVKFGKIKMQGVKKNQQMCKCIAIKTLKVYTYGWYAMNYNFIHSCHN